MATLLDQWEEDTDIDIQDYSGLTDDHAVCNCHSCGRLLLARSHARERGAVYVVTDGDTLPPVVYRMRHLGPHRTKAPECVSCYRASRPRPRTQFALPG